MKALFTSVWDGGYAVTTKCKVDVKERKIYDIEKVENQDLLAELDVLVSEHISFKGKDYPAYAEGEAPEGAKNYFTYA